MRDIRVCEAVHEARSAFQEALVAGAAIQERHFVRQLRQEPVYQMAEFFYLLRAFRLDSEEKIRRYAELHNRHLEALRADPVKMHRLGLSPTRVQRGMFSPDSIPKLVENYRSAAGAIDQSDLSRLLIEVMSPETCRKTTVTLTEAGYLERRRSPYQSVLVRSTGAMERLFARSLRHVRHALGDDAGGRNGTGGKRRRSGRRAAARSVRMMLANAPSGAGRAKRPRLVAIVAMALLLLPQAGAADLVGHVEERAAVAGRPDAALIEANPLLRRLRREYPRVLRDVLERLRAPAVSHGRSLKC